jgi:hypothetical protein
MLSDFAEVEKFTSGGDENNETEKPQQAPKKKATPIDKVEKD